MSLFHFVEKDNGELVSSHLFGKLPFFVVSDVTRGRADKFSNARLFHILAHINSDEFVFVGKQRFGQRFCKFRFPYARRSYEQEHAVRFVRIVYSAHCPSYRERDGLDRFILTYDAFFQMLFEIKEFFALRFVQSRDRYPRLLGDNARDIVAVDEGRFSRNYFVLALIEFIEFFVKVVEFLHEPFERSSARTRVIYLVVDGARLIFFDNYFLIYRFEREPCASGRFVDNIDSLIGQKSVGYEPIRKSDRGDYRLVRY